MNCNYCEWRCSLTRGEGRCRMYTFKDGVIQEKYPFTWSRCQAEEIEKVPIFHFLPDERILQLGSFNCNASCAYCMNASIASTAGTGNFCITARASCDFSQTRPV